MGAAASPAAAAAAASPAAAAAAPGSTSPSTSVLLAQTLWFATRRSSLVRMAAPGSAAAGAGGDGSGAAVHVAPVSTEFLYAEASPAELKTARRYKFLGGFTFDWSVEQVLPPDGGAKTDNAASKLQLGA